MKRSYISRRGPLNEEERLDLARHPVIGEQEAARSGADRAAQLLVRWHQEWWNGMGYPDALRGEQIPLAARILRVADAYCALTDDRPFRRAGTEDEARKHLAQWAGLEFDPRVVRAFLTLHGLPELRSHARRETDGDAGGTKPTAAFEPRAPSGQDERRIGNVEAQAAEALTGATTEAASDLQETLATAERFASQPPAVEAGSAAARNMDRSVGGLVPEAGTNPYASPSATTPTADAANPGAAPADSPRAADERAVGGGQPSSPPDDENPLGLDRR